MSTVIFLSLHDLGVYFIFGAFVAGTGLLLAEVAWRWEHRQRQSRNTNAAFRKWACRVREGLDEVEAERRRR